MATAAMLKIAYQIRNEQLQPDFDEIRYTVVKTHAEFENHKNGPLLPFSKLVAATL
jgi:hypothetical protein